MIKVRAWRPTMKLLTFGLILLLVILGEFVEIRDAYRPIRPYKHYRPRPSGYRPRWYNYPRPSRYPKFKKGPPKRPHRYHYGPSDIWHEPRYAMDHIDDEQPYTIEIELPKRLGSSRWRKDPYHHRNYDAGEVQDFYSDDRGNEDYLEEDVEELEERVLKPGKKRVRVKLVKGIKPRLRIKISRDDNLEDIADSTNLAIAEIFEERNSSSMSLDELGQMIDGDWMPENPVPSFPEKLRGA